MENSPHSERLRPDYRKVSRKFHIEEVRDALNRMGVKLDNVEDFVNGKTVPFQFSSNIVDNEEGFARYADNNLSTQIFWIESTETSAAARAFVRFRDKSFETARSVESSKVEIQGFDD